MYIYGTIDQVYPHLFTAEQHAKFRADRAVAALSTALEEAAKRERRAAEARHVQALEDRIRLNRTFKSAAVDQKWSEAFKVLYADLCRYRARDITIAGRRGPWAGCPDDYLAERAGKYADERVEQAFGKAGAWENY